MIVMAMTVATIQTATATTIPTTTYQFFPAGLLIMFFVFCNADETLTKEQSNICRLDWRCYE